MTLRNLSAGCALALLLATSVPAVADHHATETAYAANLAFVGGRSVDLAEAIPQDKYSWRPSEGVRSVSEAIAHIAGANYFFAGKLGTPPPEGVDPSKFEEITDKAKLVEILKASNEHLAKAFNAVENRDAAMDVFGRDGTVEHMMLIAIGHVHEHFGQLIAYARSNEIAPPWSQSSDG